MRKDWLLLTPLARFGDLGLLLLLRWVTGAFLVWQSHDNIFSAARMDEFERFLAQFDFSCACADGALVRLGPIPVRDRLHPRPADPLGRPDHHLRLHRRGVDGALAARTFLAGGRP